MEKELEELEYLTKEANGHSAGREFDRDAVHERTKFLIAKRKVELYTKLDLVEINLIQFYMRLIYIVCTIFHLGMS